MPAKEWELLETRTISGRGLFQVPPSDDYRHFYLYVDVIRLPRVNFSSSKWNPDRSEYAKITWLKDEYVTREDVLHYEHQRFEWAVDPTGYLATSMACMHAGVLGYLDYLAPFVLAPPLIPDPTNPIYTRPLKNIPTSIKIVCRGDTAITASLYFLEYDVACDSGTPNPKEPPEKNPPPQQPEYAPIGDISPPYEDPDDNGDTQPYSGDESAPVDPLPDGEQITVRIVYQINPYPGFNSVDVRVWTPVVAVYEQGGKVKIDCFGDVATNVTPRPELYTYTAVPPDPFSVGEWTYELIP